MQNPVMLARTLIVHLVAGAKFEPENTRLMDKQQVKSVLLASESPYFPRFGHFHKPFEINQLQ